MLPFLSAKGKGQRLFTLQGFAKKEFEELFVYCLYMRRAGAPEAANRSEHLIFLNPLAPLRERQSGVPENAVTSGLSLTFTFSVKSGCVSQRITNTGLPGCVCEFVKASSSVKKWSYVSLPRSSGLDVLTALQKKVLRAGTRCLFLFRSAPILSRYTANCWPGLGTAAFSVVLYKRGCIWATQSKCLPTFSSSCLSVASEHLHR